MHKTNFKQIPLMLLWLALLLTIFIVAKCMFDEEVDLMIHNGFAETVKLEGCSFNGEELEGCSVELKAGENTFSSPKGSTYPDHNKLELRVIVSGHLKEYTCRLHKVHHSCMSEIGISKDGLFCGDCLSIF